MSPNSDLDARLLAAHAMGDKSLLVRLYAEAADAADNQDARGFYLTQAYVFALDAGHDGADALRAELVGMGREA